MASPSSPSSSSSSSSSATNRPTAAPPFRSKVRFGILATCVAAILFVGANTGAMLKEESQVSQARQRMRESPEERLKALEARRRELVAQRNDQQQRLDQFVKASAARAGEVDKS